MNKNVKLLCHSQSYPTCTTINRLNNFMKRTFINGEVKVLRKKLLSQRTTLKFICFFSLTIGPIIKMLISIFSEKIMYLEICR